MFVSKILASAFSIWTLVAFQCVHSTTTTEDEVDHRHRGTRQIASNIDAAMRNPSFVRFQLACLLDRSPCDRIGQRIKIKPLCPCGGLRDCTCDLTLLCPDTLNRCSLRCHQICTCFCVQGLLPEMVATGQCSQCTPQEIGQAGKVILFIQDHYPMEYELLEKKFLSDAQLQEEPNFD